jgi:RNA recognition motif-containing protein
LIQQQNQLLQNLGKMKTNRSAGPQNRYNPLSGNQQLNNPNGVANLMNNGANFGNSSPWNNMIQQQQSQYSANTFGNSSATTTGFENLINTIGTGAAGNQYQQQANYLNLNPAAAAAAMAAMAGLGSNGNNLLDGNNPLDSLVNKPLNSLGGGSSSNSNIIYVYGIGSSATESDLYALFTHCGRILRVNVIKNPKTGQCKGYGFVVFETYEEAYFAVHNMNGYMYHNRPLQVSLKSFKSINNSNISNISSSNNSNNNNNNYNNRLNNSNSHQHSRARDKKRH